MAAHWRYKEGAQAAAKTSTFEDKIEWLRKLLAWQEDLSESGSLLDDLRSQVFEDRVYVFTPRAMSSTCRRGRRRSTSPITCTA